MATSRNNPAPRDVLSKLCGLQTSAPNGDIALPRPFQQRSHDRDFLGYQQLERVREIGLIELLIDALPERVGSPLSVNSLREHLGVGHATVEHWLSILENLYRIFRIPPFGSRKIRTVKKLPFTTFCRELEMP